MIILIVNNGYKWLSCLINQPFFSGVAAPCDPNSPNVSDAKPATLRPGDGPLALRYLGLGAEASRQELRCCEKLLPKSLQEASIVKHPWGGVVSTKPGS